MLLGLQPDCVSKPGELNTMVENDQHQVVRSTVNKHILALTQMAVGQIRIPNPW